MACGCFVVEIACNGDFTGVGVDGEQSTSIVVEAVGHRVAIGVRRQGGDAHTESPTVRILADLIGRGIAV